MSNECGSGAFFHNGLGDECEYTKSQDAARTYSGNKKQVIVKGAAGSGKSVVLMGRAVWLLKNADLSKDNCIALFSYTNSLTQYAKESLSLQLDGNEKITVCTPNSYIKKISDCLRRQFPEEYPKYPPLSSYEKKEELLEKLLVIKSKQSNHRFYRFDSINTAKRNAKFWIEEFEWMLGRGITQNNRAQYLDLSRKGRGNTVKMNKEDRLEAFGFFCEFLKFLEKNHYTDWLLINNFVSKHRYDIPNEMKFDHVLIDEAQDLPYIDILTLISLAKVDVMIAMDANQRLYKHYWSRNQLGIDPAYRYLKKSFRCSYEIDHFAELLRVENDQYLDEDDKCRHIAPLDHGPKPKVFEFADRDAEKNSVVEMVKEFLKDKRARTAIILRTNREIYDWSELMSQKGIYHDIISGESHRFWWAEEGKSEEGEENVYRKSFQNIHGPGLKICTIHSAKGLEFHNVILPHFKDGRYPARYSGSYGEFESEEQWFGYFRNLSYVAMTRARINLIITYFGESSAYLEEIKDLDPESFKFISYHDLKNPVAADDTDVLNYSSSPDLNKRTVKSDSKEGSAYSEIDEYEDYEDYHKSVMFTRALKNHEAGDPEGTYQLATYYEKGEGTVQDVHKALELYEKCIPRMIPGALYSYGKALMDGVYLTQDFSRGLKLVRDAAHKLHYIPALLYLSDCLFNGNYLEKNVVAGLRCLKKAAECEDGYESKYRLAKLYKDGFETVLVDSRSYQYWLERAADQGCPEAKTDLAVQYLHETCHRSKDEAYAVELLRSLSNEGNPVAQYELAHCYESGVGVVKDLNVAKMWIDYSCRSDYPPALFRLYEICSDPVSDQYDADKADKLLRKASALGYEPAKIKLQQLENNGKISEILSKKYNTDLEFDWDSDVFSDPQEYYRIFSQAAICDDARGCLYLALCYYQGVGTGLDEKLFVKWIKKAVVLGSSEGEYLIGYCMFYGYVFDKDLDKSYEYLCSSLQKGYLKAGYFLAVNYPHMQSEQVNSDYLKKASEDGVQCAYYDYAKRLESGLGLNHPDLKEAAYWFSKDYDENGNEKSKSALKLLDKC